MKILITGGLGYIGSHISYLLKDRAIILDNESNSSLNYKKLLPSSMVIRKNCSYSNICKIFNDHKISGVIHLAGFKSVNESVSNPIKYYKNNILSSLDLLSAMREYNINNLIFSSSATVYGDINTSPLKEEFDLKALNPYANTKIIIEKIITDYARSNKKFKAISLRYFNPIGANLSANLYDQPLGAPQNLVPVIMRSLLNNKVLNVFGDNYDTPDGTCIRDYIHVSDLANSHIKALENLKKIKNHICINIGLGKGLSVLELIEIFEKTNGIKIKYKIADRRQGDVAISYANNLKAIKLLNWKPKLSYEQMCYDSWESFNKK